MILDGALNRYTRLLKKRLIRCGLIVIKRSIRLFFRYCVQHYKFFLIVFIQSLADFSNPLVLGGSFDVIATQIYFYIGGSQLDWAPSQYFGVDVANFLVGDFYHSISLDW